MASNRRVTVSASQVAEFRRTWPGCTLEGEITFEHASNGDLVDIEPYPEYVTWTDTEALRALSYDAAKGYGKLQTA